jgi:hypothetical protein
LAPNRYRHFLLAFTPGRPPKGLLGSCAIALLALALSLAAGAQETENYRDEDRTAPRFQIDPVAQAHAILEAGYQTELPNLQPPEKSDPENPRQMEMQSILPNIMFKIGLVLGGIILLVVIVNLFYSTHRWTGEDEIPEYEREGFGFDQLSLEDPDQLAAGGRYAEAIHAMLLRALALAAGRLDLTWPHSLTSREIMGSASLTPTARENLDDLITRVEIHHFGGRVPQADDFQHCRRVYQNLAADPIKVMS